MRITFLGTGTSSGVPVLGCNCETCSSLDSRNWRNRSSIHINSDGMSILIDTPPEMRLQLINNDISHIDAILYTHPHADHLMGFDDIRGINRVTDKIIPCYGNKETIAEIKNVFHYIFNAVQKGGGLPEVTFHDVHSPFSIGNLLVQPLPVKHGVLNILGYRIGKMAYITDSSHIPEETLSIMEGIEVLILGALRYRPHSTHMNIPQALEVINRIGVRRAYLTHLSHDIEHTRDNERLPDHVRLAYDGLRVDIY